MAESTLIRISIVLIVITDGLTLSLPHTLIGIGIDLANPLNLFHLLFYVSYQVSFPFCVLD